MPRGSIPVDDWGIFLDDRPQCKWDCCDDDGNMDPKLVRLYFQRMEEEEYLKGFESTDEEEEEENEEAEEEEEEEEEEDESDAGEGGAQKDVGTLLEKALADVRSHEAKQADMDRVVSELDEATELALKYCPQRDNNHGIWKHVLQLEKKIGRKRSALEMFEARVRTKRQRLARELTKP